MDWLWTWGGLSFGYRNGDDLWTGDGQHVGQFKDDEVFALDGRYLGEIRSSKRLISNRSKSGRRTSARSRKPNRVPSVAHVSQVGNVMVVGCEDFQAPSDL